MHISHADIINFRALESVSIPLNRFSVLLGENDVGARGRRVNYKILSFNQFQIQIFSGFSPPPYGNADCRLG